MKVCYVTLNTLKEVISQELSPCLPVHIGQIRRGRKDGILSNRMDYPDIR